MTRLLNSTVSVSLLGGAGGTRSDTRYHSHVQENIYQKKQRGVSMMRLLNSTISASLLGGGKWVLSLTPGITLMSRKTSKETKRNKYDATVEFNIKIWFKSRLRKQFIFFHVGKINL